MTDIPFDFDDDSAAEPPADDLRLTDRERDLLADLALTGMTCGLDSWQEWVANDQRFSGQVYGYDRMAERDAEVLDLFVKLEQMGCPKESGYREQVTRESVLRSVERHYDQWRALWEGLRAVQKAQSLGEAIRVATEAENRAKGLA